MIDTNITVRIVVPAIVYMASRHINVHSAGLEGVYMTIGNIVVNSVERAGVYIMATSIDAGNVEQEYVNIINTGPRNVSRRQRSCERNKCRECK